MVLREKNGASFTFWETYYEEGAAEGRRGAVTLTSLPQGAWGPLTLGTMNGNPKIPTRRGAPRRSLCFTISVFTLNSRILVREKVLVPILISWSVAPLDPAY